MKEIMIKNGNEYVPYIIYSCKNCKIYIGEDYPKVKSGKDVYCGDCAFLFGIITEKQYLHDFCFWIDKEEKRAVIHEGKIHIGTGKFPWERTSRDRECKEYKKWRKSVFERDKYTCKKCGQVGGTLNAHHIKSYKNYPKLRYSLKNGLTLCEKCHREAHRKKRV